MTFSKGFLIALFSLALFAFSSSVTAATTETKPAVAAKTDAKAEVKTEPKAEAAPAPKATPERLPNLEKLEQKVDIKNLPKNLTPLIPNEGDPFILSIGESKLITAARPRKCLEKEAPTFDDTKLRLPPNDLITYSDGGVYERFSRKCDVNMPARAVLAVGVKKGSQKLLILGNQLTVIVK